MSVQTALAALGDPTRLRIVELLRAGPRTVGEVAAGLGALQPQTTKHLQTLEAAGIIQAHRLGRRRIVGLNRAAMTELAEYFAAASAAGSRRDDEALERYERAIADEETRLSAGGVGSRTLRFTRSLAATATTVWSAWTDPRLASQWWAPHHFSVLDYELRAVTGGSVRVALREGDGATYESIGEVRSVTPGRRLVFDLAPIDAMRRRLFDARHTVVLKEEDRRTTLTLEIDVTVSKPEAAAAVAGLEQGWEQLLDRLDGVITPSGSAAHAAGPDGG